jgi:hypothetical protein
MIIASHGDSAARGPNGHRPFAECPLCANTGRSVTDKRKKNRPKNV